MAFGRKKQNGRPVGASRSLRSATMRFGGPVEVVATQQHAADLAALLGGQERVAILAELKVESYNPVGLPVVGVYISGRMAGRLPRDVVEHRRQEILDCAAAHGVAAVDAVVRAASFPMVTIEPEA